MKPQDNPNEPPTRPHVYDGIREFDQRLPNWWLQTLYWTILFSIVYWVFHFQSNLGQTDQAKVEAEFAAIEAARLTASLSLLDDDKLWQMSRNAEFVKAGAATYAANCALCHGKELEGGIGLTLADNTWKYGAKPTEVFKIIAEGSPDVASGMKSWVGDLGPQRVAQVLAFVLSSHDPAATGIVDPADLPPSRRAAAGMPPAGSQ